MSFYETIKEYENFDFKGFLDSVTDEDIVEILQKDRINRYDFLSLLSKTAKNHLEDIAKKAKEIHLKHFGKSVVLFTPIYIANYCVNRCSYCSYNVDSKIKRHKMSYEEVKKEAEAIKKTELKNILVLTGEDKKRSSVDYILGAIDILKNDFDSISIEIQPLSLEDYIKMKDRGVDGLAIYQETYNEKVYDIVHKSGPKKDYLFRLDTPQRALEAGIRSVTIGPLLGLSKWEKETFFGGLHLEYLQNKFPQAELSISVPRIRPGSLEFDKLDIVNDIDLVQILLAYRIFLPYVATSLTTREGKVMRDNLVSICVSKMSAGVTTEVGGHTLEHSGDEQFEISDPRGVDEIKKMLLSKGYQPIVKNWMQI